MKVFGNRVVIREDKEVNNKMRESGLYLPDSIDPVDSRGVVVATGHQVDSEIIQPGDRVIFNDHAGTEIMWGARSYLIMRDQDVMIVEATHEDPYFEKYHENNKSWMVDLSERKA
jgi:co-chaperonin GroES (HSP10)